MKWIRATDRLPGAGKIVTMKWEDGDTEWKGEILFELAELQPHRYGDLLWKDDSESKGIEAISDELENLNPFNRPEYNEMYSAGYSNAVARLRELIKQKGGQP